MIGGFYLNEVCLGFWGESILAGRGETQVGNSTGGTQIDVKNPVSVTDDSEVWEMFHCALSSLTCPMTLGSLEGPFFICRK